MMKAQQHLEALALQILENPATYTLPLAPGQTPLQMVREAVDTLGSFLLRPCAGHDCNMPLLTEVVLDWAVHDPMGYAAFVEPVVKSPEQQELATLPGLWNLQGILAWLADDHEYVLENHDGVFRLNHQEKVTPFQPLIRPTALALNIVGHRRMQLPSPEICPMSRHAMSA